jgi:DNA modification methylase
VGHQDGQTPEHVPLTEKPVALTARAIQFSLNSGENVIDFFGGSDSTQIAAEQTGRVPS